MVNVIIVKMLTKVNTVGNCKKDNFCDLFSVKFLFRKVVFFSLVSTSFYRNLSPCKTLTLTNDYWTMYTNYTCLFISVHAATLSSDVTFKILSV